MIRVIHFLPTVNYTSGICNLIMNYYRKINKDKIQFDFIYFGKDLEANFKNEIIELGGRVIKINHLKNIFKLQKEIENFLNENNYDRNNIIFHNHQIAFTIFLRPILKRCGVNNFIVHNHMTKWSDKILSSIRNCILCFPIKFMNVYYFACSKEAAIFAFGKKRTVSIMSNGIDYKHFLFSNEKRNHIRDIYNLNDKIVIGHVGHFERVKNQPFLIEIFQRILNENHDYRLLLVGKGKYRKKTDELISKYGLEDYVLILENRKDIDELLCAMDVFVFPSIFEGLGISAIEAQASGLTVVMSSGVPDEANVGSCIKLSLNDSIDLWKEKIMSSIRFNDEERKEKNLLVQNSKFNIENEVKKIEKEYLQIINTDWR